MLSYRTIAGIGAAVLALMALSQANKRRHGRAGLSGASCMRKTAGRLKGIIRRRNIKNFNATNDVI